LLKQNEKRGRDCTWIGEKIKVRVKRKKIKKLKN